MSDESGTVRRPEDSALAATVDRLRTEIEGLHRAMRTRGVIEQAKGLLMERFSCSADEAFERLVQLSQRTNMKLVEVAAGVLGARTVPGVVEEAAVDPVPVPTSGHPAAQSGWPVTSGGGLSSLAAGHYHLAKAALAGAASTDALASALVDEGVRWLGADAVVLALLEPDGALRVVTSAGVPAQRVSEWQRIPPQTRVPMMDAVQGDGPVWLHSSRELTDRYPETGGRQPVPGASVFAMPLRVDGRTIGALAVGWPQETGRDDEVSRYLQALAAVCGAALLRLDTRARAERGGADRDELWFRAVLDTLMDPVVILAPVRNAGGDGAVTDFTVDHANAATVDIAGRTGSDIVGRRITELYPGMVASGVLRRLIGVAATGEPYEGAPEQFIEVVSGALRSSTMTLHAVRFLDGVLVSWRSHDEDVARRAELSQAQRLAELGAWRWDPGGGAMSWSPEVFRILARDPSQGPLAPAEAAAVVLDEDLAAVRAVVDELIAGERAYATLEFRVVRPDGEVRTVRGAAEAVRDPQGAEGSGGVVMMRGAVQDVTSWRRTEEALVGVRGRLADRVREQAAEHRVIAGLQHALMSGAEGEVRGLSVAARYLPAETASQIGGDWYDVLELADGKTFTAVGDISGHGLGAAAGMAQLRHALRGIAYTGAEPAQTLTWLNQMVCQLKGDYIASVVCGRFNPVTRTLTWAQAGHPPPVLVRGGEAVLLDPPEGVVLGAFSEAAYEASVEHLQPGDTLLVFTDGLVERRGHDLASGLDTLLEVVREVADADVATGLDVDTVVDHVMRRMGAPNLEDDTCLLAIRIE